MEVAALAACLNTLLPKLWEHRKEKAKLKTEIKIDIQAISVAISRLDAAFEGAKYKGDGTATGSATATELKREAREYSQQIHDSIQRFFIIKKVTDYAAFAVTTKAYKETLEDLCNRLEKSASKPSEKPEDPYEVHHMDMGESQQELLELVQLPGSRPSEGKRKVVSIIGFGGVGKTLLAKLVYNKDKNSSSTPPADSTLRAMVTATAKKAKEVLLEILKQLDTASKDESLNSVKTQADNFNELGKRLTEYMQNKSALGADKKGDQVLNEILKQVDLAGKGENTKLEKPQAHTHCKYENLRLYDLGKRLAERLREKRYFIVIDDMESKEQWNSMNDAFPKDGNGDGTIIVTTTIKSVADACSSGNGYVYKLSPLDENRSRELFFKDRLWARDLTEDNASEILKKCDGLPLAIVSMSQSLEGSRVLTSNVCKAACKGLGAELVKEKGGLTRLRWVLMNKYTSLTGYNLRACLLYFCMYKHNMGAAPKKNSLIRRWEAERFLVEKNTTRRPTDVGAENLETLVDHNIIQHMIAGRNGAARRYRPPGMMLEYISQISMCDNFASLVSEAVEMGDSRIRRLSFRADSTADVRKISEMDLSIVLTLAVSGIGCEAILDFKKYELLAVLDLKECPNLNNSHVIDICKLLLLKYLSLGDTIGAIPRDIGHLILLETLEMRTIATVKVYSEVFELPNLKHLLGNFMLREQAGDKLTKLLEKASDIETVTGFVTKTTKGFPQLMCHMMRLRKAKIYCDAEANLTDQETLERAVKKFTGRGMNTFHRGGSSCSLSINLTNSNGKAWAPPLAFLQCGGSLDSLKLRGPLGTFPLHTVQVPVTRQLSEPTVVPTQFTTITGIRKLCLSHTYNRGKDILATLTHMITLETLKLEEVILGPITIESDTFRSLVRLFLVGETSPEGITIRCEALPSLVSLHLISKAPIFKVEDKKGQHPAGDQSFKGKGKQAQLPIPESEDNQVQLPNGSLRCLEEIALDSRVNSAKIKAWKIAAKGHPNRPTVLLV